MTYEANDEKAGGCLVPELKLSIGGDIGDDYVKLRDSDEDCCDDCGSQHDSSTRCMNRCLGFCWWAKIVLLLIFVASLAAVFLIWVGPFFVDKLHGIEMESRVLQASLSSMESTGIDSHDPPAPRLSFTRISSFCREFVSIFLRWGFLHGLISRLRIGGCNLSGYVVYNLAQTSGVILDHHKLSTKVKSLRVDYFW